MTAPPRLRRLRALALCCALASPPAFAVDVYEPDDHPEFFQLGLLVHGQQQMRDLEGTNQVDYVYADAVPGRSYEVRMFAQLPVSASIGMSRRNAADELAQNASGYAFNATRGPNGQMTGWYVHASRVMNWIEPPEGDVNRTKFIRVADASGLPWTAGQGAYAIDMRETTLYCARYNNTGSQSTVLIVQRTATDDTGVHLGCDWTARFYDQSGDFFGHPQTGVASGLGTQGTGLYNNGMVVINTAGVPGVANTKGSIQIAHTCGYGRVQAKAVSLEPSTGFSFDTPCAPRP